jgi:hypothetical protein
MPVPADEASATPCSQAAGSTVLVMRRTRRLSNSVVVPCRQMARNLASVVLLTPRHAEHLQTTPSDLMPHPYAGKEKSLYRLHGVPQIELEDRIIGLRITPDSLDVVDWYYDDLRCDYC